METKFKVLDVVALLKDIHEKELVIGQVGTIVEELGSGTYEVEFTNNEGETIAVTGVDGQDLLLLHYELKAA